MKSTLAVLSVVFLCFVSGCDEDSSSVAPEVSAFAWAESEYSPGSDFFIMFLKVEADQSLYATGLRDDHKVIARLEQDGWHEIAVVDEPAIFDFAVDDDIIYYSTPDGVKSVRDNVVELLIDGGIGVEMLQNRLIIGGKRMTIGDNEYSVIAYDGNSFIPIDNGSECGRMNRVNNKLFIPGYPLRIYDGSTLAVSEYPGGGFFNVDSQETIYSWMEFPDRVQIRLFQGNGYQDVGDFVMSKSIVNALEFYQQTIVFTAVDAPANVSQSFYLNEKDHWVEIPTPSYVITSLTRFQDRVFAVTINGTLLELTAAK